MGLTCLMNDCSVLSLREEIENFCPSVDESLSLLSLDCGKYESRIQKYLFLISSNESQLPCLVLIQNTMSYSNTRRKQTIGLPKGFVF